MTKQCVALNFMEMRWSLFEFRSSSDWNTCSLVQVVLLIRFIVFFFFFIIIITHIIAFHGSLLFELAHTLSHRRSSSVIFDPNHLLFKDIQELLDIYDHNLLL